MKKFAGRVQKVNTDVIGLDVHKDVTVFSHLDAQGAEVHAGKIPTDGAQVLEVIRGCVQGRVVHVALEASGGMFWLYDLLVDAFGEGYVHVANPRCLRVIANSKQKNDENDAFWLAHYTSEGRLPEAWIPTGVCRELRLAVRARIEAVRMTTRTVVQIRSHLRQLGLVLPGRRFDAETSLRHAHEVAAQTPGMNGMALRLALQRYEGLRQEIGQWEEKIAELSEAMPEVKEVQRKLPGVGPILAAVIAAESGPIRRFRSPRAYAKYTGLTPSDRSTGGRTIHGSITREGSKYLRWALGQAVLHCMRTRREDGAAYWVRHWVEKKERRTGSKKKVRVAAARKMATSIWWMFHRAEQFDVAKPFGGTTVGVAKA